MSKIIHITPNIYFTSLATLLRNHVILSVVRERWEILYKTRLPPSLRQGQGPVGPHVPACRAPQPAAAPRRPAAGHAGTRSAKQHRRSSGRAHMEPHLISSAVYIPKVTPTSRRHGTTLDGFMANEQLLPGRQPVSLSRWKRRATGSTTRSGLRRRAGPGGTTAAEGRHWAAPRWRSGAARLPGGQRAAQHGGPAGRGRLLAAGAVPGPAVPPPGRPGELSVRVCREGRAGGGGSTGTVEE